MSDLCWESVLRGHEALLRQGVLAPVDPTNDDENRLWVHCDMANMVEGSYQVRLGPNAMTAEHSALWLERLGDSYRSPALVGTKEHERRYWMLDSGQHVGTVLLYTYAVEDGTVPIYALYTFPQFRGRGLATRTLDQAFRAFRAEGLGGISLDTYWTWQKSLRFYLDRGWWVCRWKRNIELFRHGALPEYRVVFDGDVASFDVSIEGQWRVLLGAQRQGWRLHLSKSSSLAVSMGETSDVLMRAYCVRTFAVMLASRGWPLIRSARLWQEAWNSVDGGEPEGLALKLEIFEAFARKYNWAISTPRIPGIRYRDLRAIR